MTSYGMVLKPFNPVNYLMRALSVVVVVCTVRAQLTWFPRLPCEASLSCARIECKLVNKHGMRRKTQQSNAEIESPRAKAFIMFRLLLQFVRDLRADIWIFRAQSRAGRVGGSRTDHAAAYLLFEINRNARCVWLELSDLWVISQPGRWVGRLSGKILLIKLSSFSWKFRALRGMLRISRLLEHVARRRRLSGLAYKQIITDWALNLKADKLTSHRRLLLSLLADSLIPVRSLLTSNRDWQTSHCARKKIIVWVMRGRKIDSLTISTKSFHIGWGENWIISQKVAKDD